MIRITSNTKQTCFLCCDLPHDLKTFKASQYHLLALQTAYHSTFDSVANVIKQHTQPIYYSYFTTLFQIIDLKIKMDRHNSTERKEAVRSLRKSLSQRLRTIGALLNLDAPTFNHSPQETETKPRKVLIF